MGQGQGKDGAPPTSKPNKKNHKTLKGTRSSQIHTESDGGAFTLPWDLRDGGLGNGPSFGPPQPPPPSIPPPESPEDNVNRKFFIFFSWKALTCLLSTRFSWQNTNKSY